jgi:hypothetical protein
MLKYSKLLLQLYLDRLPDIISDIVYEYYNPEYYFNDDALLFNIVYVVFILILIYNNYFIHF